MVNDVQFWVDNPGSDFGWIIRGVEGELYPCKPGIFEKTYEIIEAA